MPAAALTGAAAARVPACATQQLAAQRPCRPTVPARQQRRQATAGGRRVVCYSNDANSNSDAAAEPEPEPEEVDQSIRVKCMLAEGSGKLDLSECELSTVPPAVAGLTGALLGRAGSQGTGATVPVGARRWARRAPAGLFAHTDRCRRRPSLRPLQS